MQDQIVTVWQIAAGDGNRDYHDVFLRFGLACVGSGEAGEYREHVDVYTEPGTPFYRSYLRPFCEEVLPGDILILKRPAGRRFEILAVGRVTSGYRFEPRLEDVDGWPLQHVLDVSWRQPDESMIVDGLRRGTLSRVQHEGARVTAASLFEQLQDRPVEELPVAAGEVTDDHLVERLIDHGVPAERAEIITSTIWRVRRLASWYQRRGDEIGEHEIRTFLIVPLLLALGWPEQRIKIEFSALDIALFDRPYAGDAEPTLVIESKRLFDGLGGVALQQAQTYAMRYPTCRRLIVSDGLRYKLYLRDQEWWSPEAYANLLKLRDRHPYDEGVAGADELFLSLLP